MADPAVVECPHNVVTAVVTNVTTADIFPKAGNKEYWYTYRETGGTAPAAPTNIDDPDIPVSQEWIRNTDNIVNFVGNQASDLYFYCTGGDELVSGYVAVHS